MKKAKPHSSHHQNFHKTLEIALKHINDAEWLAENSVLASPYYLGAALTTTDGTYIERGEALQNLLQVSIAEIEGKEKQIHQTILIERYLKKTTGKKIEDMVGLRHDRLHAYRQQAIDALAKALAKHVRPSLQLDIPPTCGNFVGRELELITIANYYTAGHHISISGVAGSGKTTLVAHFVQQVNSPIFWFTIRPGFNDSVLSFAFALGLFAHQHGSSSLWFELVADQGKIAMPTLTSLMAFTIAQLALPPLICIDDVDKLLPTKNQEHGNLIWLWESLCRDALFIFIGQQLLDMAEEHLRVKGLSMTETAAIFTEYGVALSAADIANYHAWTQGNVRLLKLCCSVLSLRTHELAEVDKTLGAPPIDLLVSRIWLNLPKDAQDLMKRLSVYRDPVYLGTRTYLAPLRLLASQQIVEVRNTGISLQGDYRSYVYNKLGNDEKRRLHAEAADVRSSYGQYSAAVYHLIHSEQVIEAVELWQSYKQQELAQGQATNIIKIFRGALHRENLAPAEQDLLHLICGELEKFLGNTKVALEDIRVISSVDPFMNTEKWRLDGEIKNEYDPEAATRSFAMALQEAGTFLELHIAQIYKGAAWAYWRQRNFTQAENELDYAQIEIDNMRGNIANSQGKYESALRYYTNALSLAREINARDAIAKILLNLSIIHTLRGEFDSSLAYLQESYQHYKAIQKVGSMVGCRITTAVVYNLAHDYQKALTCLGQIEQLLTESAIVTPRHTVLFDQAKAETLLGLRRYPEAIEYVKKVIATNDRSVQADAHRTYGEILTKQEEWEQAEQQLRKSLVLAEQNDDPLLSAYGQRALGKFYLEQKRYLHAQEAFQTAIALFELIQLPNEVSACKQLLKVTKEREATC